jgi:hypothetical protein
MKALHISIISVLLCFVIGILAVARVYISNSDSTEGDKLTQVLEKIDVLEHDNQVLSQNVASVSALFALSEKAMMSGYQNNSYVTLSTPLPLALSKNSAL